MNWNKKITILVSIAIIFSITVSGCNLMNLLNPSVTPEPPAAPLTELTICLGYEPESLYPYRANSQAAREVLQAIYDGPIDSYHDGHVEPVILKKMPAFADGSAFFTPVTVSEGDEVVNTYGELVSLQPGTRVFPSGCTSPTCALTWDGTSDLQLDQLTAAYALIDGILWSDGWPLSAADSVYAFQVASHPATPISKRAIDQTDSYSITDEGTLEWVGKPGLVTDAFEDFFWAPMPEHAWGRYSAEELLEAEEVNRTPLGWGAYVIDEWQSGEFIRLRKNPIYFRMPEGLPKTDIINFNFVNDAEPLDTLVSANAKCDIISSTALGLQDYITLTTSAALSEFVKHEETPSQLEMLAFGITPYSYDDGYYPFGGVDRPDFLGDERVRQAIAYCIDRDTISNKLLGGAVEVNDALLSTQHPLLTNLDLTLYAYDPTAGIALLEQVGWEDQDRNPQTPLTSANVFNVPAGTVFELDLLTSASTLRSDIAREIAVGLENCGIKVSISQLPANGLYQPGPEGFIFGRNFDLALLSWKTGGQMDCKWFMTGEIPSDANYWLGEKTGGANYFGFSNEEFDASCSSGQQIGLEKGFSEQADQKNLRLLNRYLPFIPIYHQPGAYLVRNLIEGINVNSVSPISAIEVIFNGK